MKLFSASKPNRWVIFAFAGTLILAVSGTALAVAGGEDRATHARNGSSSQGVAAPQFITGESTAGGCRTGYDTQTSTLVPPDDSTPDNVAAATVNLRKPCPGAVVGSFVGEMATNVAGDFIHLDMRATCTGTGGFAMPCTVGQQVFASPGHTFVQTQQTTVQTRAMTMVWPGLRRGLWRFEVLPGGNNSANVQFRTFVVEAYNAG